MIDKQTFREQGYIYDSIENYPELIDIAKIRKIKENIDSKNYKIPSRYDYWYKYKDLSYMEDISYDKFTLKDSDEESASYVFNIAHRYQIEKMKRPEFYPTWVFGTSKNSDISNIMANGELRNFQEKFAKYYYDDKLFNNGKFNAHFALQFYDEGCEIKLHDDGKPEHRLCVFIYFLNDEWDEENGGYLILHKSNNESIKLKPTFPNFVVLDSDINLFHEVEIVKKDTKYNIVCFYAYEPN